MRYGWMIKAMLLAVIALSGFGCVAQSQYDKMNTLYRRASEQNEALKAQLEECSARIKALQEARNIPDAELQSQLAKAFEDANKLRKALAEAEDRLRKAGQVGNVLIPELDQALKELADSDPNLMTYDPARGMIRFKSDLTFPLGSTEVSKQAQTSLAKLAEILQRPVAQKYEADIVGHTDNVRIAKDSTRAKSPTNWHLSVHRSIAVKDVLEKAGVPAMRMEVAGYSEYRPVTPNSGSHGAEANRRVEIFLVPMNYSGPGAGAAEAEPAATPAKRAATKKPAEAPKADEAPESFK